MSDNTDPQTGRFLPGNNASQGRPKGSRNKLGEAFVADLYADWIGHGKEAIEKVRAERPQDYLKVTASILPKQLEVKTDAFDGVSDEELAALVTIVRAAIDPPSESRSGVETKGEPESPSDVSPLH